MPIKVQCPHCETFLKAPEELAGQQARCVNCDELLTVPGNEDESDQDNPGAADAGAFAFPTGKKRALIIVGAVVAVVVIILIVALSRGG